MASKNPPDMIIPDAGWLTQFAGRVVDGLREHGMTDEVIHRLNTQMGADDMKRGISAFVDAIVGPTAPSYDPETGVFRFEVNYDESIEEKTAEWDPKLLAWVTGYATDKKFPDDRTGRRIVSGRIMHFDKPMGQDKIEQWAKENGKLLARPKQLVDFSRAFPRRALNKHMPLAAPGQFWTGANGIRHCFYLNRLGPKLGLSIFCLSPSGQWLDHWRFLVLDKEDLDT